MHNSLFSVFKEIISETWAIDAGFARSQVPLVSRMLENHDMASAFFSQLNEKYPPLEGRIVLPTLESSGKNARNLVAFPHNVLTDNDETLKGSITGILPISGPLTKNGGFCSYGMNDYSAWLEQVESNDAINGVVLVIDSPGGTVDGTEKLANVVKKMKKPVVALVDGLAASAAFWIASAADRIYILNQTSKVGSVGVAVSLIDISPKMKKDGYVFHEFVSDLSEDKNADFDALLDGNYDPIKQSHLNPIARLFIDTIKTNRPETVSHADEWSKGKTFFATDAIKLGLVDSFGNLEVCIDYISSVSKIGNNSNFSLINKRMTMDNKKIPHILSALGMPSLEKSEDGFYLQEGDLTAIEEQMANQASDIESLNNKVLDKHTEIDNLKNQLNAATEKATQMEQKANDTQSKLDSATTEKVELQETIDGLNTEVTNLKSQLPNEDPKPAGANKNDFGDAKPEDTEANLIYSNRPVK